MRSRRSFLKTALGSGPASRLLFARSSSIVRGVTLGVQSYSFRDRPLDQAIRDMGQIGFSVCELWQEHIEPPKMLRDELRKWRETVPIEIYGSIRQQMRAQGVKVHAFNYSFRDDFSDGEIARGFEMAKALGAKYLTASSNPDMARRINLFASRAEIPVGMHNHDSMEKNEFSRPEDFEAAMKGNAFIWVNLDIGHFVAAGYDPIAYLQRHPTRIVSLHIKDRKKNHGPDVPFGQGDTPIRQVLHFLEQRNMNVPAMIEYEYEGANTVAEVERCLNYCRDALMPPKPVRERRKR
jgi:sugar phosphate isomerase/epimerase